MTGETHRAGGLLCTLVGFLLLRKHGLLLPDVNEFVQLAVMYPFAKWGSVASDLDHHWESCPEKDPPSWVVNKALHLTTPVVKAMDKTGMGTNKSMGYKVAKFFSASHRSWQTHSDLTLLSVLFLLWAVLTNPYQWNMSGYDSHILALILAGISIGIVAHFILDMLTPQGVWCSLSVIFNRVVSLITKKDVEVLPEKWRFVPKMKCFATGGAWETFICKLLKVATVVLSIYFLVAVAFPSIGAKFLELFPYEIKFN